MNIQFAPTAADDADTLVALRIAAMRDSLERIGRFDPERARARFLSAFAPEHCRFIVADGTRVGFAQVRPNDGHLALEHFYIAPAHQGKSIGSAALRMIAADADARSLDLHVGALRGSDSNRFYQRHGFAQTGEDEWDIYYVRRRAG
ncbi:GNAT family N-acetyltransferase [Burkholderia alba]|uniref:GNAT family N-acetyltransferase n=1 Tax=Burkholderia alba TaxID=2683677 RepID=UPI002B05CDA5|nr:GNAT family N-acetyltransferase [Burkholderia alba]